MHIHAEVVTDMMWTEAVSSLTTKTHFCIYIYCQLKYWQDIVFFLV
jgi:hypothetical protein